MPSNQRTITLRRTRRASNRIGSGEGASVVLQPGSPSFLTVSLPPTAINPVVSFTGSGARLFHFGCRSATFRSSTTFSSGRTHANTDGISSARLRAAGLC